MAELFATGHIVEMIVLLMCAEFAALALWRRQTGRGIAMRSLIANFMAGAALLLALRAALTEQRWQAVSSWLLLGLIAHVFDLNSRWSRKV